MTADPDASLSIEIRPEFADRVDGERLLAIVQAVLDRELDAGRTGGELTLVVVDDAEMQALNRAYRGIDAATDVLAFAANEGEPIGLPDDAPSYLGDLVISYPTAEAQALERGAPVVHELALLAVHGCLHLLGYDHAQETDRLRMWARQAEILESLGYQDPDLEPYSTRDTRDASSHIP